jgi:hypothetical protein
MFMSHPNTFFKHFWYNFLGQLFTLILALKPGFQTDLKLLFSLLVLD